MKKFYLLIPLLLVVPLVAFGAGAINLSTVEGVFQLACRLFYYLFIILIFAAVVFVLLSAFDYLKAGGDPKNIKVATNKLMYAIIAVVVAIVARNVPYLAANIIGTNLTASSETESLLECQ